MKPRVFLDTNVFIYAFEFSNSNSSKIIDLLNKGEIEAITSEKVLEEVTRYFKKFHNLSVARKFRRYLLDTCTVIMRHQISKQVGEYQGKIKEKDVEQLATTKKYGIKFLIAYDKDFESFEEYRTPKKFLELLKIKASNTEF